MKQLLSIAAILTFAMFGCGGSASDLEDGQTTGALSPVRRGAADFTVQLPQLRGGLGQPGVQFVTQGVIRPTAVKLFTTRKTELEPQYAEPPHARVTLPRAANGAFLLSDDASGVRIGVEREGMTDAEGRSDDAGLVTWPSSHLGRNDVVAHVSREGLEDFVVVDSPASTELAYVVSLQSGVAGLRLVSNALEFLDDTGVPRLRVSPPFVVDSAQKVVAASLSVEGCDVDADPRPAAGREFVRNGEARCRVVVTWDSENLVHPILVDPSWGSTVSMASPRFAHGCLDPRGVSSTSMVCTGGINHLGVYLALTEVYAPGSNTWSVAGSMATPRAYFAGVPSIEYGGNGAYFVAGGLTTGGVPTASAAEFSVTSGVWSNKPNMGTARVVPAASGINGKILVSGGWDPALSFSSTTEVFNYGTNTWSAGPSFLFGIGRAYHTSTKLLSGDVLIAGGHDGVSVSGFTAYYIASTNTFATSGAPVVPVFSHTATLITAGPQSGKVYIAGGNTGSTTTSALQRWEWTSWVLDGSIGVQRDWHSAVRLADGKSVLFAGGYWPYGSVATGFVRDTSGSGVTWSNMGTERASFAGGLVWNSSLGTSRPVVSGGWRTQLPGPLQTSEVFTP